MTMTFYVYLAIVIIVVGCLIQKWLRHAQLQKDFDQAIRDQMGDRWYDRTRNKEYEQKQQTDD